MTHLKSIKSSGEKRFERFGERMRDSIDQIRNDPYYSQNYVELSHKEELSEHIKMIKALKNAALRKKHDILLMRPDLIAILSIIRQNVYRSVGPVNRNENYARELREENSSIANPPSDSKNTPKSHTKLS